MLPHPSSTPGILGVLGLVMNAELPLEGYWVLVDDDSFVYYRPLYRGGDGEGKGWEYTGYMDEGNPYGYNTYPYVGEFVDTQPGWDTWRP